jgi:hypothetical protein
MKRKYHLLACASAIGLLLTSACVVPYSLVSGHHVATAENFVVDLPQGWRQHNASADALQSFRAMLEKRHKLSWDVLRITRDGLLLQEICIGRIPVAEELPNTKRKLSVEMIPLEVAEVISGDMLANSALTHQEIIENSPATVGGYSGFKLHYTYRTEERLKIEGLFYGALVDQWLYYVLYEAPAQHYFAKDLQIFETTRNSFQISKAPL